MKSYKLENKSLIAIAIGIAVFFGTTPNAHAAKRRSLTWAQAERLIKNTKSRIPLQITRSVLYHLNRQISTAGARRSTRVKIKRSREFRDRIMGQIRAKGLPIELFAIPMVETGFRNLRQKGRRNPSAGLWQFIPATARSYGLKVNGSVDERLYVNKSTRAALRYLSSLHGRYKDWRLAIIAYNMGYPNLNRGIRRFKTRNPWKLIRNGVHADKGYLAKVMSSAIILNNPHLVAK